MHLNSLSVEILIYNEIKHLFDIYKYLLNNNTLFSCKCFKYILSIYQ